MGCDSSKQEEQEVGEEGKKGKEEHSNKVQTTDGVLATQETDDTVTRTLIKTVDENENEEPRNLRQSDCTKDVTKTSSKSAQKNAARRQSSLKPGVLNAWDAPPRGKAKPLESIEHARGPVADVSSETGYHKEGVDLHSTSLNVNTSGGPRSSPDDIDVNSCEDLRKCKVMTKAETEQAFDPSDLIDIEKFKAANAPASKKSYGPPSIEKADQEYQPHQFLVTYEPLACAAGPMEARAPVSAELVPSPSDSNVYDEDDKELMANIERDYLAPQNLLPGAVE